MSRLFQSGGIVAWGENGVNRYSRMVNEKGNRVCCDIRAVGFSVYGETSISLVIVTPIIPAFWIYRWNVLCHTIAILIAILRMASIAV